MIRIQRNSALLGFVGSFIVISILLLICRFDLKARINDDSNIISNVIEKWIVQKLDNFDNEDSRTWLMRYYENCQYSNNSGNPIFIYLGGEWTIQASALEEGKLYLTDLAKEFRACLFYTEHRFYGKSRPTNDTSLENLRYLTVEQTLEDFANFIRFLKMLPNVKDSKVLLFGASYSGTLAVWLRQQYPHLVDAVWASSAVLELRMDFMEYKEQMTEVYRRLGGENCTDFINKTFTEIEEILRIGNSSEIEKNFNLIAPLKTPQDHSIFMSIISDEMAWRVQFHENDTVQKTCEKLMDPKFKSGIEALGNLVSRNHSMNVTYEFLLHRMRNTSWDSEINVFWRPWYYQICTQVGFFQTSSSRKQIFGTIYSIEFFKQFCLDIFGIFTPEKLEKTNEKFGGLLPNVTKVYFTHGSLDPWRLLGVQEDLNEQSPAVVIANVSHCYDMWSNHKDYGNLELLASKNRTRDLIKKWLEIE